MRDFPEKSETKLIEEEDTTVICPFCKSRNVFIIGTSRFPFACCNCNTEITEADYLKGLSKL